MTVVAFIRMVAQLGDNYHPISRTFFWGGFLVLQCLNDFSWRLLAALAFPNNAFYWQPKVLLYGVQYNFVWIFGILCALSWVCNYHEYWIFSLLYTVKSVLTKEICEHGIDSTGKDCGNVF